MLFPRTILERIIRGEVTLAFRRWRRTPPRPGATLRTPLGELAIEGVRAIEEAEITEEDAISSGMASRAELLASLPAEGTLLRIEIRYRGSDPRADLRDRALSDAKEITALQERLRRLDRHAPRPWTRELLVLIGEHPGLVARELAEKVTMETPQLKRRVRQLKELGLTESLVTGYRLSPRGRDALAVIRRNGDVA